MAYIKEKYFMENMQNCCSCGCNCCSEEQLKIITIDFLYLDLETCECCRVTEAALQEAVAETEGLLKSVGLEVTVNRIHIKTKEQAVFHKLISSPTIRVNGKDIDTDIKESLCESCGDICGENVDCRVWTYKGKEYDTPPKAMLINAILSEVYDEGNKASEEKEYRLPENLAGFFKAMKNKGKNNG